jgi:hypothetical protein
MVMDNNNNISFESRACHIISWLLMAGLLVILWVSIWFAVLGGLDVIHHSYPNNVYCFPSLVEHAERFLRHWASHAAILALIGAICACGMFSKRREIYKTTVIVIFLALFIIGVCTIFGSAFSAIVPDKIFTYSP